MKQFKPINFFCLLAAGVLMLGGRFRTAPATSTYRNVTFALSDRVTERAQFAEFKSSVGRSGGSVDDFMSDSFGPMAHAALDALQDENGYLFVNPCVWERVTSALAMKRGAVVATNLDNWNMFDTGVGLYLFVPKKLADQARCELKINTFTPIIDPLDMQQFDFKDNKPWQRNIDKLFVSNTKTTFSIFMTGHGLPAYDSYTCCVSIDPSEWRYLLDGLQRYLRVNVLCVNTCYGLAQHFEKHRLFNRVRFPIVSITATEAYTYLVCNYEKCTGGYAACISKDVPRFFQSTRGISRQLDPVQRRRQLAKALVHMMPSEDGRVYRKPHHIPAVLWPGKPAFESVVVDGSAEVKLSELSSSLATNVDVIHVDVGHVGCISIAGQAPRFVSVVPGNVRHTCEEVRCPDTGDRSLTAFAERFFTVEDLAAEKIMNIKKLQLGDQEYEDVIVCHDPSAEHKRTDWVCCRDGDGYRRLFLNGGSIAHREQLHKRPV